MRKKNEPNILQNHFHRLITLLLIFLALSCSSGMNTNYGTITLQVRGEHAGVRDLGIILEAGYMVINGISIDQEGIPTHSCYDAPIQACDYYIVDLMGDRNQIIDKVQYQTNRYKGFRFQIDYPENVEELLVVPESITNFEAIPIQATSGIYLSGNFPVIGSKEWMIPLSHDLEFDNVPGQPLILSTDSHLTITFVVRLQEWLLGINYQDSDEAIYGLLEKNIQDVTSYEYLVKVE